jgi:hypothetical protein
MPTPSSHPATVIWNGATIGRLTSFRSLPGTGVFSDITHIGAYVVGTGMDARVVRQWTCHAIDPGTIEVTVYGCPEFFRDDIGMAAPLTILFDGGSLQRQAFLESFDVSGSVGAFLVGRATFKLTGEEGAL